jgi:hypothetical protein
MAKPSRWQKMFEASKEEAVLAVKLFNDPTGQRNLEGFVVHMHLAWLYLLQADWTKQKRDYRIPDPAHKGWFKKVEGEHQTPSLEWFVRETWGESSPIRGNLEFFIKLRNKIEHRHSGSNESLATVISGQCHALLLNYEESVVSVGGQSESLATTLRFPVFIGGFTDKGKEALVKMTKALPADLRTFLAEYDNSLHQAVSADPRYCLRLTVVLEKGNRKGDLSMQFFNADDLTDDEKRVVEGLASKGYLINHHKKVSVSNLGHMKAKAAVEAVRREIPFSFNMQHFTDAYKLGNFRPPNDSLSPEKTRTDFVVYDDVHKDYTYTPTYVKHLVKSCSTASGFKATTGRVAVTKPSTQLQGALA